MKTDNTRLAACDKRIDVNQELNTIIGMDIISQGDFCVRNQDGKTVLSFSMEDKQ